MNRTLSNVLVFTAGATIGAVVAWKYFKSKYEFIEEYETDSVDEEEEDAAEDESEDTSDDIPAEVVSHFNNKPPLKEYVKMVKQLSYNTEAEETEDEDDVYAPYIIRPEEYGEIHAYETLSLNYYADGVLTDELDNRIEDVESMVPEDFAKHFGEFEDYAVFVRNDERKCDYEILRDLRNFADVIGDDLHPSEDE